MAQPLKNYLRSARKRAGLSQEELAFLVGGRGAKLVSRYERFEREPMLPAALACAVALGAPVHELFAGIYHNTRRKVQRRAKVMEMQLGRKTASGESRRKQQSVRRILETLAPESL